MTELIQPVILCGGSGTRLWPLSRSGFPKQFLCLTGAESLFQQAAKRLAGLGSADTPVAKPIIVTGEEHRFLAAEQLREAARPQLSPAERKALKVFGWCSAADAATTIFALHRGAVELNPILGPSPSAGALVASKVIFNVGAHALIVHGDGEWAPWVNAAGWMQCGAAAWNLALAVTL